MSVAQQTRSLCVRTTKLLPVSHIQEGRGAKLVSQLSSTEMCLGPGDFLMDAWEQRLQTA